MSLVVCGKTNKYGNIVGHIPDSKTLNKNEWDFKVLSAIITPLTTDLDDVFELGCSFSSSICFNYELDRFLDKNTPAIVSHIQIEKNKTKTITPSNSFPWMRVENAGDKISISLVKAGTESSLPENSVSMTVHIVIKRIK